MIECGWHLSPNKSTVLDPVNLVFYGNASADTVARRILSLEEYDWRRSGMSGIMYAYVGDDTLPDVAPRWKEADGDLALGPAMGGTRVHLRLYDCLVPDRHNDGEEEFGQWCLAGIHREHAVWPGEGDSIWDFPKFFRGGHVIHGWNEPRDFIRHLFTKAGTDGGVGEVLTKPVGTEGMYQWYWFDGDVTFIELI